MSRSTFDLLRWPIAGILLLVAAFVLLPNGDDEAASVNAQPSVTLEGVGGQVASPASSVAASAPPRTPIPTVTPAATRRPTPRPTATLRPRPSVTPIPQADGFTAEVLACRSLSGSTCNGELGTLPADAGAFSALVRFTAASAGDRLNAILDGPSGPIDGFPYALQGGGDGYYYTQFQAGGLPPGRYTLTATRNGDPVATTAFRIGG